MCRTNQIHGIQSASFNPPHLYLAPQLERVHRKSDEIFGVRKLESLGYRRRCLRDPIGLAVLVEHRLVTDGSTDTRAVKKVTIDR